MADYISNRLCKPIMVVFECMEEERIPILNILYQKLADTQLECLLNLKGNNFIFNKILSLIVAGYFRDIFLKNKRLPNEIKAFIIQYAQLCVSKYEVNIYNGTVNDATIENVDKSQYMTLYEERIFEKHIAFSFLKLGDLFPQEIPQGYITFNVEQFAIRIRAILNDETPGKYSNWINFQTTNTFVCDVGIKDSFNWIADFDVFWNKSNLQENIDISQWLLLFKKCGLNEYELKRIYCYILNEKRLRVDKAVNTEKICKRSVLWFVHIDVYRTYNHTAFVCEEWYQFRTKMQRYVFPNYVEYGRRSGN